MKKLLSMALAMMLLFASVGVFAEGEATEEPVAPVNPNLILNADFEPNKEGEEVVASKEGITTSEGTIVDKKTVGIAPAAGTPGPEGDLCIELEPNKRLVIDRAEGSSGMDYSQTYKMSFWFYTGQTSANNGWTMPFIDGSGIKANGQWYTTPARTSTNPEWTYYEIYFDKGDAPEDSTTPSYWHQFKGNGGKDGSYKNYYDDLKIEKVDGASITFAKTSGYATSTFDANFFGKNSKTIRTFSDGTKDATTWVYSRVIKSVPVSAFTGATRVIAQYTPKTLNEETTLIAVVYEKQGDKSVLKNIYTQACPNKADAVMSATDETVLDHYLLQPTTTYLDIPEADYAENCYVKAFMWSSTQGMLPLGSDAVLGK